MAAVPVVTVVAEGHDNPVCRNAGEGGTQALGEPCVRGDGTGLAALPVFVIGHHDQLVRCLCQRAGRPERVVDRHGDRNELAARGERSAGLLHQADQIGQTGIGQVLEVEHDARIAAPAQVIGDLADKHAAAARVVHQAGGALAIPHTVGGVLQDGHDQRPVQRIGDNPAHRGIVTRHQRSLRIEAKQGGSYPIDRIDVPLQRRRAIVGPRCVEGHRERVGWRCGGRGDPACVEEMADAVLQPGHLSAERKRGEALVPDRQGRGDGHVRDGGRENGTAEEKQCEKRAQDQPCAAPPATRWVEENRSNQAGQPSGCPRERLRYGKVDDPAPNSWGW